MAALRWSVAWGNDIAPGSVRGGVPGARPAGPNPLRGRDGELALLHEHLARLRSGAGTCWLLEGAPGLGKSRVIGLVFDISGTYGVWLWLHYADQAVLRLEPLCGFLVMGARCSWGDC